MLLIAYLRANTATHSVSPLKIFIKKTDTKNCIGFIITNKVEFIF